MPDVDGFWRRHFSLSSPLTIVLLGVVIASVTGLVGAAVWTSRDSTEIRRAGSSSFSVVPPAADSTPEQETTTTKPDLSMEGIEKKVAPLVWVVNTLDPLGRPSTASAFAVGVTGGQTYLLTSLAAVAAATHAPAPVITVENGSFNAPATLWTWDEERDLALLAAPRPRADLLDWATNRPEPKTGDRVFAVAGPGEPKVTPGLITHLTASVVEHNVFVDDNRRGGPIVNVKGEVVAMASAAFTGGGNPTDAAFFSVPIHGVCDVVMHCAGAFAPATTAPAPPDASSTTTTAEPSTTVTRRSATTTEATEPAQEEPPATGD